MVLEKFSTLSEATIARKDMQVGIMDPQSLERHLLYALRVSRCVPTLRKLETLVSRWGVARSGASGFGLDGGQASPNWHAVQQFLVSLYEDKFQELAFETTSMALEVASKRKSKALREKALMKALASVEQAADAVAQDLPGVRTHARACADRISAARAS
jgi:hypothetical protein